MNKLLSILLTGVVLFSFFGCNPAEQGSSGSSGSSSSGNTHTNTDHVLLDNGTTAYKVVMPMYWSSCR